MSALFRIVDYNYAAQDTVAISASSENSNFPAENIGHEFRSKVWRSSGYFVITSSNNRINFKETFGGPELTATVAVDEYGVSGLAAAIKSAMEAASVNARTYTVSQSASTGKWTITGQVYLDILFSSGTDVLTSIRDVIGFGSSDFTGAITYTGASAAIHTEEGVVIDILTAEEIDTVSVLFDPRIGIKLSDSAQIFIQASATNAWTSPGFSQEVFIDNTWDVITLFLTTPEEYRFWRVKVVDPQNAFLYVELGTIVLGKYLNLGRCVDNGYDLTWDEGSRVTTNDYGNNYVDIYPIVKELSFNFNILTYEQQNIIETAFRRVGNRDPLFVALDTEESIFDKDHQVVYGRFQDKINFKHLVRNYFSSSIKIRESL